MSAGRGSSTSTGCFMVVGAGMRMGMFAAWRAPEGALVERHVGHVLGAQPRPLLHLEQAHGSDQ
eukprot:scaffold75544_cov17-Tisochrysis_lutea.AAC.2